MQLKRTGQTSAALRGRPSVNKLYQNECLSSSLLHVTHHQLHTCLEISHLPVGLSLSLSKKKKKMCMPHILFTRLYAVLCCIVICNHPPSCLSPRQQVRQRVIKVAPAASCLMSLSADYRLGATSEKVLPPFGPTALSLQQVTLRTAEPRSHLCNFILKIIQLPSQRKRTVGELLFFHSSQIP